MQYNYISSLAIVTEAIRGFNIQTTAVKYDAVEWIGNAIEMIGYYNGFIGKAEPAEVNFFKIKKPDDLFMLQFISHNGRKLFQGSKKITVESIIQPDNNLIQAERLLHARPKLAETVEFHHEHHLYNPGRDAYTGEELDLALSSLDKQVSYYLQPKIYNNLAYDNEHYFWDTVNCWNTSLEEGVVSIFYLAFIVDEEGFPLVVDEVNYRTALRYYIIFRMLEQGYKHPVLTYADAMELQERWILRASNQQIKFDRQQMHSFMANWTNFTFSLKDENI